MQDDSTAGGRRTFVVGVDASEESDGALDWACAAAGPDDRIVVVHAWEIPVVTGYDMQILVEPSQVRDASAQGLAELLAKRNDARLEPAVREGHAGQAIVEEVKNADVAVVGHRGSGRMALMLGSTANYVLHHTERPVVIVRGDVGAPRRVVVGVDDHDLDETGTNESVRALQWAFELPHVEHIRVIHTWYTPNPASGLIRSQLDELSEVYDEGDAVAVGIADLAGEWPDSITVEVESLRSKPGLALIDASADADLVVVGSRGQGGFRGLLLGSTSNEVAAHSHSPVAIVR